MASSLVIPNRATWERENMKRRGLAHFLGAASACTVLLWGAGQAGAQSASPDKMAEAKAAVQAAAQQRAATDPMFARVLKQIQNAVTYAAKPAPVRKLAMAAAPATSAAPVGAALVYP